MEADEGNLLTQTSAKVVRIDGAHPMQQEKKDTTDLYDGKGSAQASENPKALLAENTRSSVGAMPKYSSSEEDDQHRGIPTKTTKLLIVFCSWLMQWFTYIAFCILVFCAMFFPTLETSTNFSTPSAERFGKVYCMMFYPYLFMLVFIAFFWSEKFRRHFKKFEKKFLYSWCCRKNKKRQKEDEMKYELKNNNAADEATTTKKNLPFLDANDDGETQKGIQQNISAFSPSSSHPCSQKQKIFLSLFFNSLLSSSSLAPEEQEEDHAEEQLFDRDTVATILLKAFQLGRLLGEQEQVKEKIKRQKSDESKSSTSPDEKSIFENVKKEDKKDEEETNQDDKTAMQWRNYYSTGLEQQSEWEFVETPMAQPVASSRVLADEKIREILFNNDDEEEVVGKKISQQNKNEQKNAEIFSWKDLEALQETLQQQHRSNKSKKEKERQKNYSKISVSSSFSLKSKKQEKEKEKEQLVPATSFFSLSRLLVYTLQLISLVGLLIYVKPFWAGLPTILPYFTGSLYHYFLEPIFVQFLYPVYEPMIYVISLVLFLHSFSMVFPTSSSVSVAANNATTARQKEVEGKNSFTEIDNNGIFKSETKSEQQVLDHKKTVSAVAFHINLLAGLMASFAWILFTEGKTARSHFSFLPWASFTFLFSVSFISAIVHRSRFLGWIAMTALYGVLFNVLLVDSLHKVLFSLPSFLDDRRYRNREPHKFLCTSLVMLFAGLMLRWILISNANKKKSNEQEVQKNVASDSPRILADPQLDNDIVYVFQTPFLLCTCTFNFFLVIFVLQYHIWFFVQLFLLLVVGEECGKRRPLIKIFQRGVKEIVLVYLAVFVLERCFTVEIPRSRLFFGDSAASSSQLKQSINSVQLFASFILLLVFARFISRRMKYADALLGWGLKFVPCCSSSSQN